MSLLNPAAIGSLSDFLEALAQLEQVGRERVPAADSLDALEAVRVDLLGRTSGALTHLSQRLGALPKEERREAGQRFNDVRVALETALEAARSRLVAAAAPRQLADPTMPARHAWRGSRHPVSLVVDEICDLFRELGFTIALGPEAESEWYNFGALNFPADHPAMDLHDTLYLAEGGLLRTHTSPVQVRTLQRHPPPIRVLAPGTVFRRDFFDATHAPAFAQIEGLAVDEGISFADLKATLTLFAHRMFGSETRTRFGPSYFPFTEPSAQMEVEVDLKDGRGPRWLEIMGCGLVHPAVLEAAGLDSERYSGWAFGMGPGRIAMARYDIPDIRLLYDSDVRFLEQFT
jgi:phenylalanyl-tRNA synthetase alpha chain